ncbi:hypothetical protein [Xanthomonas sp. BRIP62415]|uniref:hypothetical protein n=1 Tax=Xanthomonas sp. BRIP62415 TaxID=2182390 RepID=UPI000F8CB43F|nr:hypothetical protein [Xanthomonas sp. BRIP62415]
MSVRFQPYGTDVGAMACFAAECRDRKAICSARTLPAEQQTLARIASMSANTLHCGIWLRGLWRPSSNGSGLFIEAKECVHDCVVIPISALKARFQA